MSVVVGPPRMFDDLAEMVGLGPGCRVLEIGCGTGQATVPLAQRGCQIVAVELGSDMATAARHNLAGYRDVQVLTAAFEDWPLPREPFDVVVTATAFHWIDPAARVDKSAQALRLGGALATIATRHIAGGTERFFTEVQGCYERFDPQTPPDLRLPAADRRPPTADRRRDRRRPCGPGPARPVRRGDLLSLRAGTALHDRRVP